MQWLFMQHVSDISWCSNAVAVVAQTSYFVSDYNYFKGSETILYFQFMYAIFISELYCTP